MMASQRLLLCWWRNYISYSRETIESKEMMMMMMMMMIVSISCVVHRGRGDCNPQNDGANGE